MRLGVKPAAGREKMLALLAAAFFAAVSVALFFPTLFSDKLIFGYDLLYLGLPLHAEVLRCLAAHQWPLWMPDVLGGMPGIASCNLQFAYPTDFVSCLGGLSVRAMEGLDSALPVALAGTGMFLFLRRLDRGFSASLLGGLFFALSGSQISILHGGYYNFVVGIAWVPWAFWAAHKACKENSLFAWGLCGLAFSLQILSGSTQLFAYTLPAVACFALSTARHRASETPDFGHGTAKRGWLPVVQGLGVALGLAVLLSAPQLWLTLQYIPLSAREGYTHAQFSAGSMPLSETLTWLVPGFFGWLQPTSEYFGLLPWALAAAALSAHWREQAGVRSMAALALLSFFFAQGRWTPYYSFFHHLPFIRGFRTWSRILFLLTFAVCTLAAFGWDALRTARTRTAALRGAWIFFAVALASVAMAIASGPVPALAHRPAISGPDMPTDPRQITALLAHLVWASSWTTLELSVALMVVLLLLGRRLNPGVALILALSFHACDQDQVIARFIRFVAPATAVGHPHFLEAPPPKEGLEPWRVFDHDNCYPNNDILLGYENLDGTESLPLRDYQGIMDALQARPRDWASLMNERYLFLHSKISSASAGDTVTIYQNPGAYPRAWLVGRSLTVARDEDAYRLLADPRFDPRAEVAIDRGPELGGAAPRGGVTWLERRPEAFSLDVSTDKEAALVLSNFWYPSWKASVDGRDTPVLKADGGLQAVLLTAGRHRVDFRFDAGLFYDALAACLAGLVFLFGLYRFDVQSKRSRSGDIHAPRP